MSTQAPKKTFWNTLSPLQWAGLVAYLVLILTVYIKGNSLHALSTVWHLPTYDYEHGWFVPLISIYLLIHSFKKLKYESLSGNLNGIWIIAFGCLLYILSVHSHQWRIAIAGIPFLLLGAIHFYWGGKATLRCVFPLVFLLLCIPMPGLQQMTTGMQIMATSSAHWFTNLLGIHTIQEGTNLTLASNAEWDTFNIAGGCSGMRSLMALVMISFAWAYLADNLTLWKRFCLALSAIPIAVISNVFRVSSIFICAEYINPVFASKTWHDWSGLLFFFPASIVSLTVLHSILAGGIPFFKKSHSKVRHITIKNAQEIT